MLINQISDVSNYKAHIWFDEKYITNLITQKNIIKQYHITFNSLFEVLILHCEEHGKHNMHFRMYESHKHYYDP